MSKQTIVVTGATGYVASLVLPALREHYHLRLLDQRQTTAAGERIEEVQVVDLANPDRDTYRRHFQEADAVVHLAYNEPRTQTTFEVQRRNIDIAHNVYQVALEENIPRVVVASSNHAADWYEHLIREKKRDLVDPDEKALAFNFYGWAKEAIEHMGFVYACGTFGRALEVVQLRIGNPSERTGEAFAGRPKVFKRYLAAYISQRDLQQLFLKSLTAGPEALTREDGVPFQIFYGVSDNTRHFWSIANARQRIGYAPQDDSEVRFAEDIRRYLLATDSPEIVGRT